MGSLRVGVDLDYSFLTPDRRPSRTKVGLSRPLGTSGASLNLPTPTPQNPRSLLLTRRTLPGLVVGFDGGCEGVAISPGVTRRVVGPLPVGEVCSLESSFRPYPLRSGPWGSLGAPKSAGFRVSTFSTTFFSERRREGLRRVRGRSVWESFDPPPLHPQETTMKDRFTLGPQERGTVSGEFRRAVWFYRLSARETSGGDPEATALSNGAVQRPRGARDCGETRRERAAGVEGRGGVARQVRSRWTQWQRQVATPPASALLLGLATPDALRAPPLRAATGADTARAAGAENFRGLGWAGRGGDRGAGRRGVRVVRRAPGPDAQGVAWLLRPFPVLSKKKVDPSPG